MTPAEFRASLNAKKANGNIPLQYLLSKRKPVDVMNSNEIMSVSRHLTQLLLKTAKKKDSAPALMLMNDQLDEALKKFGIFLSDRMLDVYASVCDKLAQTTGNDKAAALHVLSSIKKFTDPQLLLKGLSCFESGVYFKARTEPLPNDSFAHDLLSKQKQLLLLISGTLPNKNVPVRYRQIPKALRTAHLLAISDYQRQDKNSEFNTGLLDYDFALGEGAMDGPPELFYSLSALLSIHCFALKGDTEHYEDFFTTEPEAFRTASFTTMLEQVKTENSLASLLNHCDVVNKSMRWAPVQVGFQSDFGTNLNELRDGILFCYYAEACFDRLDELCQLAAKHPGELFKKVSATTLLDKIQLLFMNIRFNLLSLHKFSMMNIHKPGAGLAALIVSCLKNLGDEALQYAQGLSCLPITTLNSLFKHLDVIGPKMAAALYVHTHMNHKKSEDNVPYYFANEIAKFRAAFKYKFCINNELMIDIGDIDSIVDQYKKPLFEQGKCLTKNLFFMEKTEVEIKKFVTALEVMKELELRYFSELQNSSLSKTYSALDTAHTLTNPNTEFASMPRI